MTRKNDKKTERQRKDGETKRQKRIAAIVN